jgi:uncharacterized protein
LAVTGAGVEFFRCHRARPGFVMLREELLEGHWSCMGGYAAGMMVRGQALAGRLDAS